MIKEKRQTNSLKEHVRNNTDCIMIVPVIKSLRAWGKNIKLKSYHKYVHRVTMLLLALIFSSHKKFGV